MLAIFGHDDGTSGTSCHAQAFFRALSRRTKARWVSLDESHASPGGQPSHIDVGIGIGAPDVVPRISGQCRIAFAVWETTRMPESRLGFLREVDEVWTPTSWGRNVLVDSGLAASRIRIVPEGVDPEIFRPIPPQGSKKRPFRFLAVGKWERRKGFDRLLQAWSRAFQPSDDVELVLHTYHPSAPNWTLDRALADLGLGAHAPVHWSRPTDPLRLVLLYGTCDQFVLATRGEGWCLPVFEALACGKPVIVPRFGALGEVLDESVADFVRVESMSSAEGGIAYPANEDCGLWAEPSVGHLAELLRAAKSQPARAQAMGRQGRAKAIKHWTWDQAAHLAISYLGSRI